MLQLGSARGRGAAAAAAAGPRRRLPAAAAAARPPPPPPPAGGGARSARETALAFYTAYNEKRFADLLDLIAEDVVYEDLVYNEPFRGRAAVVEYFKKVEALVPADLTFCVDDITGGAGDAVGVTWHVELSGLPFPFSRGCSFYRVDGAGRIAAARDLVEPTLKPGAAALAAISALAPLVRRAGPAAAGSPTGGPPPAAGAVVSAAGVFAFWLAYLGVVMLSGLPPGDPAYKVSPETVAALTHESLNFFYVNAALAHWGLNPVPAVVEHPVDEAVFNFVCAWSLMFLPAMLADPAGAAVPRRARVAWWAGAMLLTNVFLPGYMAARLLPGEGGSALAPGPPPPPPAWARPLGGVAAAVGAASVGWALAARPEYGGLAERWAHAAAMASGDRVFWAFGLDVLLYAAWQAVLLGALGAPPAQRYVPFWGMAAWLLGGGGAAQQQPRRPEP